MVQSTDPAHIQTLMKQEISGPEYEKLPDRPQEFVEKRCIIL